VLLAGAHGHEYAQFHRMLGQLARMLSGAGFPVLRFDFSGCGDSAGGPESWGLERWSGDLDAAFDELRDLAGVERVGVVGLRLGASVALAGSARRQPRFLVLWDPVVNGRAFLREMREAHRGMLRHAHVSPARDGEGGEEEVLGFPLPRPFARELDALDLGTPSRSPAPVVLLVESNACHSQATLRAGLEGFGPVRHRRMSNPHLWRWVEDQARVHVPAEILQAIVDEAVEAVT
jgi:alpha-beta hydrolase superfamily lysophospholipase